MTDIIGVLREYFQREQLNEMSRESAASYFKTLTKHALYYYEIKYRGMDTMNTLRSLKNFLQSISDETNRIIGKPESRIEKVNQLFNLHSESGLEALHNIKYSEIQPFKNPLVLSLESKIELGDITLQDLGFKWEILNNKLAVLTFKPLQ